MLLDRLLADEEVVVITQEHRFLSALPYDLKNDLRSAEVFDVTNVYRYFYEVDDRDAFESTDFPVVVPPYTSLWCEAKNPRVINTTNETVPPGRVGHLIFTVSVEDSSLGRLLPSGLQDDAKWVVAAMPFGEIDVGGGFRFAVPVMLTLVLNKGGGIVQGDAGEWRSFSPDQLKYRGDDRPIGPEEMRKLASVMWSGMFPVLMAMNLMNCKNVTTRVVTPATDEMNRRRVRRGYSPLVRYKVLEIGGVEKLINAAMRPGTRFGSVALHSCRGHFKHFDADHKLFGRHTGTYWWAQQVRGRASEGVVKKTYSVNAEKGATK